MSNKGAKSMKAKMSVGKFYTADDLLGSLSRLAKQLATVNDDTETIVLSKIFSKDENELGNHSKVG